MAKKAEVIWTSPALDEFDEIVAYIARENPDAAYRLAKRVLATVERLEDNPESGRWVPELLPNKFYREVIVRPCRVVYRRERSTVLIVQVFRSERLLRIEHLF